METRPAPACTECDLCSRATTVCVAGRGHGEWEKSCDILFVGEAPGPDEDKQGTCFIGKAGRIFDDFAKLLFPSYSYYISNAVRCFPGFAQSGVRKPTRGQMDACRRYLVQEIAALKPAIIVPMGNYAIAQVLELPMSGPRAPKVTKMAGKLAGDVAGTPVVPLQHPAWVARDLRSRGPVWTHAVNDMLLVLDQRTADHPVVEFVREPPPGHTTMVSEPTPGFRKSLLEAAERHPVAYDLETRGVDPFAEGFRHRMVGYSWKPDEAHVLNLDSEASQELHKEFLRSATWPVVHHSPFDVTADLAVYGVAPSGLLYDTKALAFMDNERQDMNLEQLVSVYVPRMRGIKDETHDIADLGAAPYDVMARRCGYDVMATLQLRDALWACHGHAEQMHYIRVVAPALVTLARMRVNGWLIDREGLHQHQRRVEQELAEIEGKIANAVGRPVNLRSPVEKAEMLMQLGIDDRRRQDENPHLISTASAVLKDHVHEHPVVRLLLDYSGLDMQVNTFARPFLDYSARDGYVHPGYNWGGATRETTARGTVSDRLSSARPNVMNPPKWLRQYVRSRFKGGKLVGADWGQIEFRFMVSVAGQEDVCQLIREGLDPHSATAKLSGLSRDKAKAVNYAMGYQAGLDKLAAMGVKKPAKVKDEVLGSMPKLERWIAEAKLEAIQHGRVKGLFPRAFWLDDAQLAVITSRDRKKRDHALRVAVNIKIQNAAGVCALYAQHRIDAELRAEGLRSVIHDQLHDRIGADAPPDEVEMVKDIMEHIMCVETPKICEPWLRVPLPVDFTIDTVMGREKQK